MSLICRSCLRNVDRNTYFYIDTFDNAGVGNTIPKDVLLLCVPEMDLYISDRPGICSECLHMFEAFHNFKNRCLASEDRILSYLKKYHIENQKKVNLKCVVFDLPPPIEVQLNNEPHLVDPNKPVSSDDESKIDDGEFPLFSCNKCSFMATDQETLIRHKCLIISDADKYKCPYCDYSSNRRYRLSYHINAKHTKANWYECDQCEYKTTDSSSLKRHQKVIHFARNESAVVFNCTECNFNTISEIALQRHKIAKHGPVIQYCTHCSYQTKDKSNFRKHLFTHGDKPRKCTQCPYQCVSPYQLERHYKRTHV